MADLQDFNDWSSKIDDSDCVILKGEFNVSLMELKCKWTGSRRIINHELLVVHKLSITNDEVLSLTKLLKLDSLILDNMK